MKFHVLQINARAIHAESIKATPKDADKVRKNHEAFLNASMGMNVRPAIELGLYEHVCDIEGRNLDDVFEYGNLGPEKMLTRYKPMTSVSVGNLVVDPQGQLFSCEHIGWNKITEPVLVEIVKSTLGT